jgi:hypothetical protein
MTAAAERSRWIAHVVNTVVEDATAVIASYLSGYKARGWACIPSQAVIAHDTGFCVRTVRRVTAKLEAHDVLGVTRHAATHDPATGRWRRRTNRYRLRFQKTKRHLTWGKNRPSPRGHACPQNDSFRASGVPRPPGAGPLERPQPPPWPPLAIELCEDCQQRPPIPGKWRCQPCQENHDARPQRRAPRPVTLPDPPPTS